MFAIAYNSPPSPSETFIMQHIEHLAPRRTLGLVFGSEPSNASLIDHLTLVNTRSSKPFLVRKVIGVATLLRTGSKLSPDKVSEDQAVAMLRRHSCKTILAEYGPNGCAVRHIAKRAGARLFVHFHGYDASSQLRLKGTRREYAGLFRQAAGIIAPSRFLASRLEEIGCPAELLHVVPCGVDIASFTPADDRDYGRRKILAVGRFTPKKAPDITIQAFARVAGQYSDARLDMIGEGPLLASCKKLAGELRLDGKVRFLGTQPPDVVSQRLAEASLFVQHSVTAADGDTEGLPVAIMEAMACGLPVISTRHSGIPEAVDHGPTGLLVDEGDMEGMAKAMIELLADPERMRKMGKAGRARAVELFDKNKSISRLQEILGLV